MRQYRSADGEIRLWLDQDEIEYMMEDELRKGGLYPSLEAPEVDVETFLERH